MSIVESYVTTIFVEHINQWLCETIISVKSFEIALNLSAVN